jgi:hypothetical protein
MVNAKLEQAKRLITQAIEGLDESHDECPSCHFQVKKQFDQYNAAKRLRAALTNIERAQGNLLTQKKAYATRPHAPTLTDLPLRVGSE